MKTRRWRVFCYLRWRKDRILLWGYLWSMDAQTFDLQLTVDKVLLRWPQAYSAFMKHKTKCVGCFMQQFCTLKDVAATYELSLEALIDDIKNTSNNSL